jgi:PAS domain-containing protein
LVCRRSARLTHDLRPCDRDALSGDRRGDRDAIIFADRDGRIGLWNRGAELIFGYAGADVIGHSLDIIIPERLRAAHWRSQSAAIARRGMQPKPR